jgi:hypothetical protein
MTYMVTNGRIHGKAFIPCRDKGEAESVTKSLNYRISGDDDSDHRRADMCVMLYTRVGKTIIPVDELRYLKAEAHSDD